MHSQRSNGVDSAGWMAVIAIMAATACGSGAQKHMAFNQLPNPTFAVMFSNGLCGASVAVDAKGQGWMEQGCENGKPPLARVRKLGKDDVEKLRAAFQTLDGVAESTANLQACKGRVLTLLWRDVKRTRKWSTCNGKDANVPTVMLAPTEQLLQVARPAASYSGLTDE